eukprot:3617540-Pyramimonas_sp.AAC.1
MRSSCSVYPRVVYTPIHYTCSRVLRLAGASAYQRLPVLMAANLPSLAANSPLVGVIPHSAGGAVGGGGATAASGGGDGCGGQSGGGREGGGAGQ